MQYDRVLKKLNFGLNNILLVTKNVQYITVQKYHGTGSDSMQALIFIGHLLLQVRSYNSTSE